MDARPAIFRSVSVALLVTGCGQCSLPSSFPFFQRKAPPVEEPFRWDDGPVDAGPVTEAGPRELKPLTDSTLSTLSDADDGCHWRRVDPITKERDAIATFRGSCVGGKTAWTVDGTRGLLYLPNKGNPALWEMTFAEQQPKTLPLPPVGRIRDLGYDNHGSIWAITVDHPDLAAGRRLTFENTAFEVPDDLGGTPGLAHAFRFTAEETWKHEEVKLTADDLEGLRVPDELDSISRLATRTGRLLGQLARAEPVDPAVLPNLAVVYEGKGVEANVPGSWGRIAQDGATAFVWFTDATFADPTGLLAFQVDGNIVRAADPALTDRDLAAVSVRGSFVLVASRTGTEARLYDVRTQKALFNGHGLTATAFWPAVTTGTDAFRPPPIMTLTAGPTSNDSLTVERKPCRNDDCPLIVRLIHAGETSRTFETRHVMIPSGTIEKTSDGKGWHVASVQPGENGMRADPAQLEIRTVRLTPTQNGVVLSVQRSQSEGEPVTVYEVVGLSHGKLDQVWTEHEDDVGGTPRVETADVDQDGSEELLYVKESPAEGDRAGVWHVAAYGWNATDGKLKPKQVPAYAVSLPEHEGVLDAEAERTTLMRDCAPLREFTVVGASTVPKLGRTGVVAAFLTADLKKANDTFTQVKACQLSVSPAVGVAQ